MSDFNGDMLTLARESRGLTQKELATRAGMTQGYLSQLEHDCKEPSAERLSRLASVLGYPERFFSRSGRRIGLGVSVLYYRKRARTSVEALRRLQAEVDLRRFALQELLPDLEMRPVHTIRAIDIEDHDGEAAEIASLVRADWNMPIGPVKSLVGSIEAAGGIVFKFAFSTRDIDAMSVWPDDTPPLFFLNAGAPADRVRFSLAHELGHVVMHGSGRITEDPEREADEFASAFLMPARDVRSDLRDLTLQRAAQLKPYWRVSMAALVRRAKDVGAITSKQYTNLFKRMSALGYRRNEPNPIASEEPTSLGKIIGAQQANGFSVEALAARTDQPTEDFRYRMVPQHKGLRLAM